MKTVPDVQYVRGPLTESLRTLLAEGEADPSGIADAGFTFAPKEHFAIVFEGEEPVASAGWLARSARVDGEIVPIAALGGVLVRRSRRGHGLSRVVSEAAVANARMAGHVHAVLLCKPHVQPLWAHLGWSLIPHGVTYTDPEGQTRHWPLVAMARPLSDEPWPPGDVNLAGPPF